MRLPLLLAAVVPNCLTSGSDVKTSFLLDNATTPEDTASWRGRSPVIGADTASFETRTPLQNSSQASTWVSSPLTSDGLSSKSGRFKSSTQEESLEAFTDDSKLTTSETYSQSRETKTSQHTASTNITRFPHETTRGALRSKSSSNTFSISSSPSSVKSPAALNGTLPGSRGSRSDIASSQPSTERFEDWSTPATLKSVNTTSLAQSTTLKGESADSSTIKAIKSSSSRSTRLNPTTMPFSLEVTSTAPTTARENSTLSESQISATTARSTIQVGSTANRSLLTESLDSKTGGGTSSTASPAITPSNVVFGITSLSSSLSLETLTAFTGESWTTTTGHHSSATIVPIIGGVIIWNLPSAGPSITYSLPNLPKFQLPPCIPGDCPNPPHVDEDTKGSESGDNDEDDEGNEEDISQEQTGSSADSTARQSTTSSTESCSGGETTVSDCRVACSTSYGFADDTVTGTKNCYTTSCMRTIGCSLQPSTTTSVQSAESACMMDEPMERYNPVATLSSLGLDMPLWMEFAISYDSIVAEPTSNSSKTAERASSAMIVSSPTPTVTSDAARNEITSTDAISTGSDIRSSTSSSSSHSTTTSHNTTDEAPSFTSMSFSFDPTTSASSSVPSTTISEAATPTPVCHDESQFPDHPSIDIAEVDHGAELFCRIHKRWYPDYEGVTNMTSDSPGLSTTYQVVDGEINYTYEVEWKDGDACQYATDTQQIEDPIGDDAWHCRSLFNEAYSGCVNGGVGGFVDAGCLRYTFTGGRDDDGLEISPMPVGIDATDSD